MTCVSGSKGYAVLDTCCVPPALPACVCVRVKTETDTRERLLLFLLFPSLHPEQQFAGCRMQGRRF